MDVKSRSSYRILLGEAEARCHRRRSNEEVPAGVRTLRERMLFIGTQFSILYTSMYSPAEAATPRAWCLWFRVSMYTGAHRFLTFELLVNPPSSGTLAFSLRLAPFLPASDSSALYTGSHLQWAPFHFAQVPPLLLLQPPSRGPISSNHPPRSGLYYVHLQ